MNTITAKELRDNLGDITRKVKKGESFSVTYRGDAVFRIVSPTPTSNNRGAESFIDRVTSRRVASKKPIFDPDKSVKQLYHEMLDNDPKYK